MKQVGKMRIWDRIAAKLELSDSAKLEKFFIREKKAAERAIESSEKNKEIFNMNYRIVLTKLHDALEDAVDRYEAAKDAVVPEDLRDNDDMDNFAAVYWSNLAKKKLGVEDVEKNIAKLEEALNKEIEKIDKEISDYQEKISICNE